MAQIFDKPATQQMARMLDPANMAQIFDKPARANMAQIFDKPASPPDGTNA